MLRICRADEFRKRRNRYKKIETILTYGLLSLLVRICAELFSSRSFSSSAISNYGSVSGGTINSSCRINFYDFIFNSHSGSINFSFSLGSLVAARCERNSYESYEQKC